MMDELELFFVERVRRLRDSRLRIVPEQAERRRHGRCHQHGDARSDDVICGCSK